MPRGNETIIIHRTAGRDRNGDPLPGSVDESVRGCIVLPRTSVEEGRGEILLEGKEVWAPPGTTVKAADEVTAQGVRYEVEGPPGYYGPRKPLRIMLARRGTT